MVTSVNSTAKVLSYFKDRRGACLALISNHSGDTKYSVILKKRMTLRQSIKYNGRS